MLKVSNQELIALMKDKKVVQMLEQEKVEDKKEEQFRSQLLAKLTQIVSAMNQPESETDMSGVVSAIKEVAKAQMEMCKMSRKTPAREVKGFSVEREMTGEISYIKVEYV